MKKKARVLCFLTVFTALAFGITANAEKETRLTLFVPETNEKSWDEKTSEKNNASSTKEKTSPVTGDETEAVLPLAGVTAAGGILFLMEEKVRKDLEKKGHNNINHEK